jgi:hypothetical protein
LQLLETIFSIVIHSKSLCKSFSKTGEGTRFDVLARTRHVGAGPDFQKSNFYRPKDTMFKRKYVAFLGDFPVGFVKKITADFFV